MITSNIGRLLVDAYNEKYHSDYDAKTFFTDIFYPLFYDHEKYLMTAGNSPLENPKLKWEQMRKGVIPYETPERRKERFNSLMEKINNNEPDASIAVGYPSLNLTATTSGQITNMKIQTSKEDAYLSWIGAGLGVGIAGGCSILFVDTRILLDIFEGWKLYREVVDSTKYLKENQINTWNGQWLAHLYSRNFNSSNWLDNFNPFSAEKDGLISVETKSWTQILIGISRKYDNPQMMGYVYSFGKTNTTIGFIPFMLNKIRKPLELYRKFFNLDGNEAETLWGTAYGFNKCCENGAIGLKAMEPKGLRDYIIKGKIPVSSTKDENRINYNTYQIWLIAMLNNEELWAKAHVFAETLQKYSNNGERGKTSNSNKVKSILETTNKKAFIEALVDVVSETDELMVINDTASIVNMMPTDNVPYFLTLIRFHYATINNNKNK